MIPITNKLKIHDTLSIISAYNCNCIIISYFYLISLINKNSLLGCVRKTIHTYGHTMFDMIHTLRYIIDFLNI